MIPSFKRMIGILSSLRLTLACLVVAGILIAIVGENRGPVDVVVAVPFGLLFVNLLAALYTNPKLHRQVGLLGFHLALAALALLAALDRLTSMSGHVEITEGSAFDPRLVVAELGPLHRWQMDDIRFVQGSFAIDYAPGMKRRHTDSQVHLVGGADQWQTVTVGDDRPLAVGGYRFYTTFNKGFAPIVSFADTSGRTHRGAIHLPSYPLNYFQQGNDWVPPGWSRALKVWLHVPEAVYREDDYWSFTLPHEERLIIIADGRRMELAKGDEVTIGGGTLRYEELRTWMGYKIAYSWYGPWLLAATLLGILSLAYHIYRRRLSTPWLVDDTGEVANVR